MRKALLAIWFLLPTIAFSQNTPPAGDIFESGAPQPVEQAFQKLYQITAQITADPSSLYVQGQVDKSSWPTVDQAQAQWDNAMGQAGTALTQDQRNNIVPCAAHLNNAIADMERGYVIHITQPSNPPAQAQAQVLYGEAKAESAKCLSTGVATDAGATPGTTSDGTPGTTEGSTPGTTGDNTPGGKGLQRTPVSGGPATPTPAPAPANPTTPPPNMAAIDKAMSDCLSAHVSFPIPQTVQPADMELALYSAPPAVKSTPFAQLSSQSQIFLEETAMALQAEAAYADRYPRNNYSSAQGQDYLVGWLDRCLWQANLESHPINNSPLDPRTQYAKFLGVPVTDDRINTFFSGYEENVWPPLPLMPPYVPPKSP